MSIQQTEGKRSGQPCIRDLRITVNDVLGYLAAGMSEAEIIKDFPELTKQDFLDLFAFCYSALARQFNEHQQANKTKSNSLFYIDGSKPEELIKQHLEEIPGGKRDRVVVKGTEIKVHQVIDMLGAEMSFNDILQMHPNITSEQIRACCAYAYLAVQNEYNLYLINGNSVFDFLKNPAEDIYKPEDGKLLE